MEPPARSNEVGAALGAAIANDAGVMGSAKRAAHGESRKAHTLSQARRMREEASGGAGLPQLHEQLLKYERSLRVCEPRHRWVWKPDADLSRLWHSMTDDERARITEVNSETAFAEWVSRINGCTCLVRDALEVIRDSAIFQDFSSRDVFREFFFQAVSENAPLAVTIDVIEAVDNTVQDFCASRMADHPGHGPDSPFVDPRTFPVGSVNWVRYREREHARLLCMCHMLQLFEDRLVEAYEKGQGATLAKQQQEAADQAMRALLELEDQEARPKGKKGKGKKGQQPQRQQQQSLPSPPPADERSRPDAPPPTSTADGEPAAAQGEGGGADQGDGQGDGQEEGGSGGGGGGGAEPARSKSSRRRQRKRANKAARHVLDMAASEHSEGQVDEIDAEFARRVAEHIRARREASASTAENADRKTNVLKLLCAKLKANLEQKMSGEA